MLSREVSEIAFSWGHCPQWPSTGKISCAKQLWLMMWKWASMVWWCARRCTLGTSLWMIILACVGNIVSSMEKVPMTRKNSGWRFWKRLTSSIWPALRCAMADGVQKFFSLSWEVCGVVMTSVLSLPVLGRQWTMDIDMVAILNLVSFFATFRPGLFPGSVADLSICFFFKSFFLNRRGSEIQLVSTSVTCFPPKRCFFCCCWGLVNGHLAISISRFNLSKFVNFQVRSWRRASQNLARANMPTWRAVKTVSVVKQELVWA